MRSSGILAAMSASLTCPYLKADVELTDERLEHIKTEHDDFVPFLDRLSLVLLAPDEVRRSNRLPDSTFLSLV
jgi:hypothetical protein